MVLYKVLDELKQTQPIVKIGAKESFLYCDKCNESIEPILDEISDGYFKHSKYLLDRNQRALKTFNVRWKNRFRQRVKRHLNARAAGESDTSIKTFIKDFEAEKANDKRLLTNRVKSYGDYVNNYTPLLLREVKEVYDSIADDNTKIIIIDGIESGDYCDAKEYAAGIPLGRGRRYGG